MHAIRRVDLQPLAAAPSSTILVDVRGQKSCRGFRTPARSRVAQMFVSATCRWRGLRLIVRVAQRKTDARRSRGGSVRSVHRDPAIRGGELLGGRVAR